MRPGGDGLRLFSSRKEVGKVDFPKKEGRGGSGRYDIKREGETNKPCGQDPKHRLRVQ